MPEPPGLVVKNGTNRLPVFDNPGPSSSTHSSMVGGTEPGEALPADGDAAAGLLDRVDRVANQVDEQLLELIAVSLNRQARTAAPTQMWCAFSSVTTRSTNAPTSSGASFGGGSFASRA